MPREQFASDADPKDESLVASPDSELIRPGEYSDDSVPGGKSSSSGYNQFTIHRDETQEDTGSALQLHRDRERIKEQNNIHPYVQTLSISNLEDCVALESACFPEQERCSREKVDYFLSVHTTHCSLSCCTQHHIGNNMTFISLLHCMRKQVFQSHAYRKDTAVVAMPSFNSC